MYFKYIGRNIVDFIDLVQHEETCMDFVSTAVTFRIS